MSQEIEARDISGELYREYDFNGRVYRILKPVSLFVGVTTHRVTDRDGIVHCLPAPGTGDCVLRWKSSDPAHPVQF